MTRLSNAVRHDMVRTIVHHSFAERFAPIAAEGVALFALVYDDIYDAETQTLMAKLLKKQRKAFRHTSSLDVAARGYRITVGRNSMGGELSRFQIDCDPRPHVNEVTNDRGSYADCAIAERIIGYSTKAKAFVEDVKKAESELLGTLGKFYSGKQIEEQWPEAMPLIGKLIPEKRGGLPAIPFGDLNARFGLPPASTGAGA